MLVGAEVVYTRYRPDVRISAVCGMLAVLTTASVVAAIISHTGIRLGFPRIDAALSRADLAMGIYAPAIVSSLAKYPIFAVILENIYSTSYQVCIACALVLAASGRMSKAREFAFAFTFCIIGASAISVFWPALGSTVFHGVEAMPGLPRSAGNFHMAIVNYYRTDPAATFDLRKIQGVVTFPSFHIVMAVLVPYALRGTGVAAWIAVAWGSLVAISAVVIGGHYVIDLIAGIMIWGFSIWWIRRDRRDGGAIGRDVRPDRQRIGLRSD